MADDEKLDWFPCRPTPLLATLAAMSSNKQHVYLIMLLRIYESGGVCRDTVAAIAMRTRLNKRLVSDALDELFREGRLTRDGDGITNSVASKTIEESKALRERRRGAGAEGGRRAAENRNKNQSTQPSKASSKKQQSHTPLQVQDSLFPNGNRALEPESKPAKPPKEPSALEIARKELFDRGKQVLGENAGGMIQKLLAAKHGNIALARAAIEQASTMDDPRQYIGAITRTGGSNGKIETSNAHQAGFAGLSARIRYGSTSGPERPAPEDLEPINRR